MVNYRVRRRDWQVAQRQGGLPPITKLTQGRLRECYKQNSALSTVPVCHPLHAERVAAVLVADHNLRVIAKVKRQEAANMQDKIPIVPTEKQKTVCRRRAGAHVRGTTGQTL